MKHMGSLESMNDDLQSQKSASMLISSLVAACGDPLAKNNLEVINCNTGHEINFFF
ncbi:hypothetical protein pdam_00015705 [Pocillopora damicornis]|uniref:Uncharacterized protein n=1 Tax=Pocillopora damicornis TaxID=46731 RepID=A0A3M6TVW8_POCDA|nr:hypothetical protein pdam_00015705 [Pocillopora damicornis]